MMEPQEIEDQEYEQVLERVAAIDVAKASGMVCTRVPHPSRPGKRRTMVREVAATTGAVLELGEQLAGEGIEMVTLEATSDYWRIWFYVLEAAGLGVQLVNARDVKNAPGRPKTDPLTELIRVPAGHSVGSRQQRTAWACSAPRLAGRRSTGMELAALESGHAASYHLPTFSSLPIATPASIRAQHHLTDPDVLISVVARRKGVSSEKTSSMRCGWRS